MNFPRPRFAVLPVSLSLTLQRFSGTLTIELPTPSVSTPDSASPSKSIQPPHQHPSIHLSLHPDFTLDLTTSSLLGSRAKLEDVPKVEQLLIARIRSVIQDRVVWPGRVEISLPGIHPHHSKKHPAEEATAGGGGGESQQVDDWTVVDRPHPLACANENLPPSFSVSDFKHRNADSDSDDSDLEDNLPPRSSSPLNSRRANLSSTPPPSFPHNVPEQALETNSSTPSAETPSVNFSDPAGPTISLHPKVHKRSSQTQQESTRVRQLNVENLRALDQTLRSGSGGEAGERGTGRRVRAPPSPTESFPGYFPNARGGSAAGLGTAVGFNSAGGTRYRGLGGVGLSSR